MEKPQRDEKAPPAPFFIGVEAFHGGRYFEAHEHWEDLWREAQGPRKALLQALIQAAVGLYHDGRGKSQAGLRMAGKALKNMGDHPEGLLEIRMDPVKRWLEDWAKNGRPGAPPILKS